MSKFEFSPETQELFNELDSLFPENIEVCKKSCRDDYKTCLDAGKSDSGCRETLDSCFRKCFDENLNTELKQRADKILEKIQESLK